MGRLAGKRFVRWALLLAVLFALAACTTRPQSDLPTPPPKERDLRLIEFYSPI